MAQISRRQQRRPRLDRRSDAELVILTRDGEAGAYAELWRRHAAAAQAVARAFSRFDSDDLISEGYARVLRAIRRGGGPTEAFRPYLIMTVKNIAREWSHADLAEPSPDLDAIADERAESSEDVAIAALGRGVTASAFRTLPSRWQEVLWYSEVDGMKPREFGPLLGLAPNAASALLVRAKRAFRQAWLDRGAAQSTSPECREILGLLAAQEPLSASERARVEEHLAGCDSCAVIWEETPNPAARLALALLPIVAGVAGAAGYLAWTQIGGPAAAAAAYASEAAVPPGPGANGAAARAAARARGLSRGALATAAAAAVIVAGGGVAAAVFLSQPSPPIAAPTAPVATSAPEPSAAPSDPPSAEPTPDPTVAPDPPIVSHPIAAPVRRPAVPVVAAPTAPPVTEPTPNPTASPTPEPPSTPAFLVDIDPDALLYPAFSGTDAEPGALVEIIDANGTVVASTSADDTGSWTIDDFSGDTCSVDPASYLPAGTYALQVRQTVDDRSSAPSEPVAITIAAPPAFVTPTAGSTVAQAGFPLEISGEPGASVQRIKAPDPAPCRPTPMILDANGAWSDVFTVPDLGPITIGLRYFDPSSGRHGPAVFVDIDAVE